MPSFFIFITGRPFLEQEQLDQSRFRLLSLVDLSESMEVRDDREGKKRSEEVRPHFNSLDAESWINQQRQNYGKVDVFGFSEERKRLIADEWNINEIGSQTALVMPLRDRLLNLMMNQSPFGLFGRF